MKITLLCLILIFSSVLFGCHQVAKVPVQNDSKDDNSKKNLLWNKIIDETPYLDAELVGDDLNGYSLFTITKENNKEVLSTYLVSFDTKTIKPINNKRARFQIESPESKNYFFELNTVELNNIKYYSNLGCNINSGVYINDLTQSPDKLSYVFTLGFSLPYINQGIWQINNNNIKLITPSKINGYVIKPSDEAHLLNWATSPLWSLDGQKISYMSNRRNLVTTDIWILDVSTGNHKLFKMDHKSVSGFVSWINNDTILYLNSKKGTQVESLNIRTCKTKLIGEAANLPYQILHEKNPDGGSLYIDIIDNNNFKNSNRLSFVKDYLGITRRGHFIFYKNNELCFLDYKSHKEVFKLEIPEYKNPVNIYMIGGTEDKIIFLIEEKDLSYSKQYSLRSLWILDLNALLGCNN